ncbi:MAG: hypothetical protein PUF50_03780, partial [Erysipelotrichaceae bacterium]|nr:hypothetical protein [Erysipelotrichaceae bacterium]
CACRFTEQEDTEHFSTQSKRQEMKELIQHYRTINPYVDINIFRSVHRVNLNTIIGYHDGEKEYSFLDDYDKKGCVEDES